MIVGFTFRNGMRLGLDLGPDVTPVSVASSVGSAIRYVGARAAAQIRKSSNRAAAYTTARIEQRKARKRP